ncbi:hypothetical protein GJ496_003844 [Pomphorhynchus laevis]|nr:hypothetical protein GJ496_003844 [Pomphorhynchus laevis]
MSIRVSLKDAVQNVQSLIVPAIQDVSTQPSFLPSQNHSPKLIKDLPNLKYHQQLEDTQQLRAIVKQGNEFVHLLYTYRSTSISSKKVRKLTHLSVDVQ